jgi:hypothetical protein
VLSCVAMAFLLRLYPAAPAPHPEPAPR